MKKDFLTFGILVFLIISLSGCVEEAISVDKEEILRFVGVWEASETDTFIFAASGACQYISTGGTFKINNGQLEVSLENGLERTYNYIFSEDDSSLTLKNIEFGDETVYSKQTT